MLVYFKWLLIFCACYNKILTDQYNRFLHMSDLSYEITSGAGYTDKEYIRIDSKLSLQLIIDVSPSVKVITNWWNICYRTCNRSKKFLPITSKLFISIIDVVLCILYRCHTVKFNKLKRLANKIKLIHALIICSRYTRYGFQRLYKKDFSWKGMTLPSHTSLISELECS